VAQGLTPYQCGTKVRWYLYQQCEQQPSRTRAPRNLDHPLERTKVQDDENDGKKTKSADHPEEERTHT